MTMTRYDPPADPYASREHFGACFVCRETKDASDMTTCGKRDIEICHACIDEIVESFPLAMQREAEVIIKRYGATDRDEIRSYF
jgi:hypothetical protein